MKTWQKIRQSKIDEGYSEDAAYAFAKKVMEERRSNFSPYSVIGMAELEAKEKLDENGYAFRVQRRDVGSADIMYLDWRLNRCNVSIVEGKVAAILSIG